MKHILLFLLCTITLNLAAQVNFDEHFSDKTMRVDLMFSGNSDMVKVYPMDIKAEPFYGGSKKNLIDKFHYGNVRFEIRDLSSDKLLYSKGYGTLFQEWQTTPEAKEISKSFYEVIKFPYPLNKIRLAISLYQKDGSYKEIYNTEIDPLNYFISHELPLDVKSSRISGKGDPHKSVDVVFIAEGYTASESEKFFKDVKRQKDILYKTAPYNEFRESINIWAVQAISLESGTDVPGERIYKNTALNSGFYTFDLARYLTTLDLKIVNDYAAVVPHDNIIVLVNSERYGGGGMYNYYSCTTSDHQLSPQVFTHEFGHGFTALADEYYTSEVAYDEFYPLTIEPWEANITTLVDFDRKWKKLIAKDVPTPTPASEEYKDVIGLFEGGGYSGKGIYRPQLDCRMKSNAAEGYCKVCQEAIRAMIKSYIE